MNLRRTSITLAACTLVAIAGCHRGGRATASSDGSTTPTLRRGNSPLHAAVASGDFETAKMLLDGGASPDALNDRGETPLMIAANRGQTPVIDLMLARHPDLDVKNRYGKSALTFAVEQQSVSIVRRLVAAGASTNVVDYKGRGLDVYAKGNPAIIDALHGGTGQVTAPPPMVQERMNAQQPTMPAMPAYPAAPPQPTAPTPPAPPLEPTPVPAPTTTP